ncbi:ATP-dependent DNA helicase-like protein [Sulfuriferula plumbiphila]|uniref:DNA 5'-3' helicase n=2 Tax=Sulfuriferula plumbiphila TaxID=171865 RepID=A0A512L8X7_9PROT|nr:ATP-dependent DNA helicase-like protein [Sulfuriferula plumbiphila]GEP30920.1 ATP-dependent DNA helicase-like protein [Sulfuriferula plumbiphila]
MMNDLATVFSADGVFAAAIPGYRVRAQQLELANAIGQTIESRSVLIAEAGTGTGKTLAYLAPALLHGGKVIISTGTKNLQDQLYRRDLPTVRAALKVPAIVALLKGRANYVCHYHLERAREEGRFMSREDVAHLEQVSRFAESSRSGDRAELHGVAEDANIWRYVTSSRENCLGSDCPHHKKCFVLEARKKALEADIVVVNHHLFFADVWLRDEGVAELLPACNTVIFDEAHQLPETAGLFFGETLTTGQLVELARDARLEAIQSCKDYAALPEAAQKLDKAARDLRLVFSEDSGRWPLEKVCDRSGFEAAFVDAGAALDELVAHLETQAQRAPGLENCWQRGRELANMHAKWQEPAPAESVRWVEAFSHALGFNTTPLSVAEIFTKQIEGSARAWIFTSATLSVKGDFAHYRKQLGLMEATSASWESPFDYDRQAMLYAPPGMPEPNTPNYTRAVLEAALPVIAASQGRAFLLFTSLRAMKEAHGLLQQAFEQSALDYPILMQGEQSRTELLERFRQLGNAVLLGSQSFWEGVDVKGEALSLVVIDKLPFAPPDDPVLAARISHINQSGGNAFMEYQLPHAVITLKQGAGRLIRDEADRGVLMICDPRLLSKPYGRRIWQSLPPMRRSRELADVQSFFARPQ